MFRLYNEYSCDFHVMICMDNDLRYQVLSPSLQDDYLPAMSSLTRHPPTSPKYPPLSFA